MHKARSVRGSRLLLPLTLLVVVSLVAGSLGGYQVSRLPGVEQRLPPNGTPLFATLTQPETGSVYPAGAAVPVWAKAVAARPVAALELWADGQRVQRKEARLGSTALQLSAFWSWQPPSEGMHTLLARVVDVAGAVADSTPVRLEATAPVGMLIMATAKGGETASTMAEAYGVLEQDVLDGNPGIDATAPFTPGQQVYIPVPPPVLPTPMPTAPAGPAQGSLKVVVDSPPSKLDLWLRAINVPAGPPAAPGLSVATSGCDARLFISGVAGAQGYFVYRLAPDAPGFERIATLPAGTGQFEYADPDLGGHVEYYVSSFNAAGESPGDIAAVDLDWACLSPHWGLEQAGKGDLWLEDGRLIAPPGIDRVYYYLTLDGKNYGRVPPEPDGFVLPMSSDELQAWTGVQVGGSELAVDLLTGARRAFDLAAAAGQAWTGEGEHAVSLEAWGWGGSGLVRLGEFSNVVTAHEQVGPASVPVLSAPSSTQLYACTPGRCSGEFLQKSLEASLSWDPDDDARQNFYWYCQDPDWTGFVWQVSTQPFGAKFDPSPPGLVASGATETAYLELDFHHLVPAAIAKDTTGPVQMQLTPQTPGVETSGGLQVAKTATPLLPPSKFPLADVFATPESSLAVSAASAAGVTGMVKLPVTYYVRVTPMNGNQQADAPSNSVVIHYGPMEEPTLAMIPLPPPIYEVEIVGFDPVMPESFWGCVEIVQNDYYGGQSSGGGGVYDAITAAVWSGIPVGTVVCPDWYMGEGSKPWYELFWDWLKGAVDWLAQAYQDIKNTIVNAVASVIPLCGDTCKTLLMTGLNAALMAVGLPPSLPSFAQLEEMGQAYVVSLLAQQVGPDCSEGSLCYEALEETVDAVKEAATAGGANQACGDASIAHEHGKEPLCLPPGVIGQPIRGSSAEPATVYVKIRRRAEPVDVSQSDLESYRLRLSTWAVNDRWVGQTLWLARNTYLVEGAYCDAKLDEVPVAIDEPLEGPLFRPVELPVLKLKPGEEVTVPVQLEKLDYWIPGHLEMIEDAGGWVHYDDWERLYHQAQLTIRASIDCYTTIGSDPMNCGASPNGWDETQVELPLNWW